MVFVSLPYALITIDYSYLKIPLRVGSSVGIREGSDVGLREGFEEGARVGTYVGAKEGASDLQ